MNLTPAPPKTQAQIIKESIELWETLPEDSYHDLSASHAKLRKYHPRWGGECLENLAHTMQKGNKTMRVTKPGAIAALVIYVSIGLTFVVAATMIIVAARAPEVSKDLALTADLTGATMGLAGAWWIVTSSLEVSRWWSNQT